MFQSLFRVFTGSGLFWRYIVILGHFGAKARRNSQLPIEPVQIRHSESTVDRWTLLLSIDSEACKARLGSQPTYGPSSRSFTILPLVDFNLIFMCYAIVLGNTRFHTFYFTQQNISRVCSSLERKSKTPSEICIGTLFCLLYSICAVYSYYCHVLLNHV